LDIERTGKGRIVREKLEKYKKMDARILLLTSKL